MEYSVLAIFRTELQTILKIHFIDTYGQGNMIMMGLSDLVRVFKVKKSKYSKTFLCALHWREGGSPIEERNRRGLPFKREREKERWKLSMGEMGIFCWKERKEGSSIEGGGGALASIGSRKRNSLLEREKNPPLERRERRSSIVVSLSPDSRSWEFARARVWYNSYSIFMISREH